VPVRSLNSAVLKWPDGSAVLSAARSWANALQCKDPAVRQVWCVGSYARGDWGVGSDLDLIVILSESDLSPVDRYRTYYPDKLPVPVDLWVHTETEWHALRVSAPQLGDRIQREKIVLAGSDADS